MRFFHISDLHLGKTLRGYNLLDDQAFILEKIVQAILERRPDCLLIAGDIYDRAVPPVEAVQLFDSFIFKALGALRGNGRGSDKTEAAAATATVDAAEASTAASSPLIVAIPGNHDSAGRLGFGSWLMAQSGLHIATKAGGEALVLQDSKGDTWAIWALPFLSQASIDWDERADEAGLPKSFGDLSRGEAGPRIASQQDLMNLSLNKIRPQMGNFNKNILLAHCFAAGSCISESETGFVGTAEQVDTELFKGFDYVALGHLHRNQSPAPVLWYSGSPLAYSVSEAEDPKGYLDVDLGEGSCRVEFVPLEPERKIRRLIGRFDEIIAAARGNAEASGVEDYVDVYLSDAEPVINAAERLKAVYPKLLSARQSAFELRFGGGEAGSLGGEESGLPAWTARDSSDRLKMAQADFKAFYRELKGCEPSDKEIALFESLAKEAADASAQA